VTLQVFIFTRSCDAFVLYSKLHSKRHAMCLNCRSGQHSITLTTGICGSHWF